MVVTTSVRRRATTLVGLALALAASSTAATAAPVTSHPATHAAKVTSTGFAGYQVDRGKKHVKSASATFVLPDITCKKSLSGVGPAVILASAVNKKTNSFRTTAAGVGVSCQQKAVVLQSIIQIKGKAYNDLTPAEGDTVTISVQVAPKVKVTVDDVTSGESKTRTGNKFTAVLAQVGCNALDVNQKHAGLDPFTKIKATKAKVNKKPIAALKPARVTWVKGKQVLVTASKISKRDDFTMSFKSSD